MVRERNRRDLGRHRGNAREILGRGGKYKYILGRNKSLGSGWEISSTMLPRLKTHKHQLTQNRNTETKSKEDKHRISNGIETKWMLLGNSTRKLKLKLKHLMRTEENDDNIFVRTALMRISRLCCGDDNERRFFKKCSIPGARCGGWLVGGKKVGKKFVWD